MVMVCMYFCSSYQWCESWFCAKLWGPFPRADGILWRDQGKNRWVEIKRNQFNPFWKRFFVGNNKMAEQRKSKYQALLKISINLWYFAIFLRFVWKYKSVSKKHWKAVLKSLRISSMGVLASTAFCDKLQFANWHLNCNIQTPLAKFYFIKISTNNRSLYFWISVGT